MRNKRYSLALVLAVVLGVQCQLNGQFEIVSYSIDAGGNTAFGGNFTVQGTAGQPDSGAQSSGGDFSVTGGFSNPTIILGDLNGDGIANLLDVAPFVDAITTGTFIAEADINQDGIVNLLDVDPFVTLLSSG